MGAIIRSRKGTRSFVFGVVLEHCTQHHLLRRWLLSAGINPETEVHIIVIPSALIYENFSKGFLDGYCVAEPWNSAAVKNQTGWIVATSADEPPKMPEKVLLVLEDFAEQRESAHLSLLAALITASRFCEDLSNRSVLAAMLAKPCYFDVPVEYLRNALIGPLDTGRGIKEQNSFITYDAQKIGAPSPATGRLVLDLMKSFGRITKPFSFPSDVIEKTFRKDIYDKATRLESDVRRSAVQTDPGPSPWRQTCAQSSTATCV
jgi:ABC-type nitrate/sulfonate/bicarbonate transport system substrate-binding protein